MEALGALNPKPSTMNPQPAALESRPQPSTSTLNPQPSTRNPRSLTLNQGEQEMGALGALSHHLDTVIRKSQVPNSSTSDSKPKTLNARARKKWGRWGR